MYMHSKFILLTLIGVKIEWKAQNRSTENTPNFKEIFQTFYFLNILGLVSGVFFIFISMGFLLDDAYLGKLVCLFDFGLFRIEERYL